LIFTCSRCGIGVERIPKVGGAISFLKEAGWARAAQNKLVCPACRRPPGVRPGTVKPPGETYRELKALIESVPEGEALPRLKVLAKRFGVSGERIRQLLNCLEEKGVRAHRSTIKCWDCKTTLAVPRTRFKSEIATEAGWKVRFNRDGKPHNYRCPECQERRKIPLYFREDWPGEGTTAAKLLQWMEAGFPYSPLLIAEHFGFTHRHKVSRDKALLIAAGKWKWARASGYRNTPASNPDSPYIQKLIKRSTPKS